MSAFNITEGVTFAKNPWRNTRYGKGTHYVRTSNPQESNTEDQKRVRSAFASAAKSAAQNCSGEEGMANAECRAAYVADRLGN